MVPPEHTLRIVSFNVNGLRAILKRQYGPTATIKHFLADVGHDADVVCLQETKLREQELQSAHTLAVAEGWESFFSCSTSKRGYSGTATFVRSSLCMPFDASIGFTAPCSNASNTSSSLPYPELLAGDKFSVEDLESLDSEGRVVVTDHGDFVLFNVYGPAITSEDAEIAKSRMLFKMRFYSALECRWRALRAAKRAVIVVGDLNIAPGQIDYPDVDPDFYKSNRPDRRWLRALLHGHPNQASTISNNQGDNLFIDCFRKFFPERRGAFTVWSTATGARANNYGSRIDLTLASGLSFSRPRGDVSFLEPPWVHAADIEPQIQGSDHCPVWVQLGKRSPFSCAPTPPKCSMRYTLSGKQSNLLQWLDCCQGANRKHIQSRETGYGSSASDYGYASAGTAKKSKHPLPRQASLFSFLRQSSEAIASDGTAKQEATCTATWNSQDTQVQMKTRTVPGFIESEIAAAAAKEKEQLDKAKNAWQKIHARMQVPRCLHGELAALKKVNKSGVNHGAEHAVLCKPCINSISSQVIL